jgi:hypothetical protein
MPPTDQHGSPRRADAPGLWRDHSLSIVLTLLFLGSLVGHAVAGWRAELDERQRDGEPAIGLAAFLGSSEFAETVFENWESEFLQMGCYVLLTVFLYQRGSAESKSHEGNDPVEEDPAAHRDDPDAPGPVKRGGWRLTLYQNSLSLALFGMFAISFAGHAVAGAANLSEDRARAGLPPIGTLDYLVEPRFWYESFQNWQSELLSVLAIVVLSIWLRQWGSPESKPVHAPHTQTGSS